VDVMWIASLYESRLYFMFIINTMGKTEIFTLSLHDALPISRGRTRRARGSRSARRPAPTGPPARSARRRPRRSRRRQEVRARATARQAAAGGAAASAPGRARAAAARRH